MRTPASIGGHPLHAILIAYPIGLWTFSLLSDVIGRLQWGDPVTWNTVALYTLGGGIAGALLSAVPGFVDLFSLQGKPKTVAITHMAINLLAVAIFAVDFGLRIGAAPDATLPLVLSIVGVVLIGVGGWLGGELVFSLGIGVERPIGVEPPVQVERAVGRPQP